MESKLYTKEQIKDAIWQELKESGYTGDNNDRAYEVIGIVVAGIEKITPTKAQPGPRWVKASERLPNNPDDPLIHYRLHGRKVNGNFYQDDDGMMFFEVRGSTHEPYQIGWKSFQYLEWLDEQPAAGREEDAAAFLTWIQKNDYYYSTHGGGYWYEWNEKEQETYLCDANAQLYELFKQQKDK